MDNVSMVDNLIYLLGFHFRLMAMLYVCLNTKKSITSGMSWYLQIKGLNDNRKNKHGHNHLLGFIAGFREVMELSAMCSPTSHLVFFREDWLGFPQYLGN